MAIDQNHRGYLLEPHLRETLCEGRVKARYEVDERGRGVVWRHVAYMRSLVKGFGRVKWARGDIFVINFRSTA